MARLTTRLVEVKDVCRILAISEDAFSRHWQSVFTETRDPEERKKGAPPDLRGRTRRSAQRGRRDIKQGEGRGADVPQTDEARGR